MTGKRILQGVLISIIGGLVFELVVKPQLRAQGILE